MGLIWQSIFGAAIGPKVDAPPCKQMLTALFGAIQGGGGGPPISRSTKTALSCARFAVPDFA